MLNLLVSVHSANTCPFNGLLNAMFFTFLLVILLFQMVLNKSGMVAQTCHSRYMGGCK
jgi:hypothetical protein